MRKMGKTTQFLNVDLDLRTHSKADAQSLASALEPSTVLLNCSGRFASLELREAVSSPADAIRTFTSLIEALPRADRRIWNRCEMRTMNVGVRAGTEPFSAVFELPSTTVDDLQRIGAGVAITVYSR
jgi:hypothetical protein